MTFEEALERLPECSYAVCEGSGLGDRTIEVWFLYFQDPEEIGDPRAEAGPAVSCEGSMVNERGQIIGGGVEDWFMPSDVPDQIPKKVRDAEWHETEVKDADFPTGFHVNVMLRVLEGAPMEEARYEDGWPEKWESFVRG